MENIRKSQKEILEIYYLNDISGKEFLKGPISNLKQAEKRISEFRERSMAIT